MIGREKTIYDEVEEEGSYPHNWGIGYGETPGEDECVEYDEEYDEEEVDE